MINEKDCELCGLWDRCKTPYLDVVGNGGKRIMFVYGNPSNKEDKSGNMMVDDPDLFLMETLKDMGIDFNEDCWRINAVQCFAGNEVPTNAINLCRKNMFELIEKLQPRVIIPLGGVALQSLIGDRTSKRISLSPFDKWVKWVIPDQMLQTYIAPLYPPDEVLATLRKKQRQLKKYDKYRKFSGKMWHDDQLTKWSSDYKILNRVFRKALQNAVSDRLETFYTHNYESESAYIERDEALDFLKDLLNNKRMIAFDYETTGIKPHREGHEILCIGISDGIVSYAFEIHNDPVFLNTLKRVLRDPDIKKIGHNMKFEETWTRVILGYKVRGWIWDCMVAAHIKDNRAGITGLKFQGYTQFGILGYDDAIDKYIECTKEEKDQYGANGFNRLKELPIDEVCTYCAVDAHLTYHLYNAQQAYRSQKGFDKAYNLFHEGSLAFADIEQNGILVDMERVLQYDLEIEQKLIAIKQEIDVCEEVQQWDGEKPFNFASPKDMKHMLYGILGYSPIKMTKKGVETYGNDSEVKSGFESTDIESLEYINSPLTNKILEYKKLYKIRNTYIAGIKREAVNGVIHPSFNLNTVSSFRSCVAKGSLVLANRDHVKYPNGVPIEEIKAGDYVYSFDDNLRLVLKKVLWAGKTGNREVIRVHYKGAKNNVGYLDVTPEHRIRLISGEYIEAQNLLQDFRDTSKPNWQKKPKSQVLSVRRSGDKLFATHHAEILEHRFIYEQRNLVKLDSKDIIHHVDGNHYNNDLDNLELTTLSAHANIHYQDNLGNEDARKKNVTTVKRLHKEGRYTYLSGEDNPSSLNLSKDQCLELIYSHGGKISKVPYDFNTFKKYCAMYNIDVKHIQKFFNKEGVYLDIDSVLSSLKEYGWNGTLTKLGIGYGKLRTLCKEYGITYRRGNGVNNVTLNNHIITNIEWLHTSVDVYDIEVEDTHNFVANEVVVHNSSSDPNFQNFSKHDPIANHYVKGLFRPRKGNQLIEFDYGQLEVRGAASVSYDDSLIKYTSDPTTDMHRDAASILFMKDADTIDKNTERFHVKNKWVFAQFYGDYYKPCAEKLWAVMDVKTKRWLRRFNIHVKADFIEHCKGVEKQFWNDMFPGYDTWRNTNWQNYVDTGMLYWPTGFMSDNVFRRNQVNNLPVQGGSFHLTLGSVILINKALKEHKLKSLCIGQIHDSVVFDAVPEEVTRLKPIVGQIMKHEILKTNPWVIVPLVVEADIYPIDGDWSTVESSEEVA